MDRVGFWTRLIVLLYCARFSSSVYPASPSLKGTSLGGGPTPSNHEDDNIPTKAEADHGNHQLHQPNQIKHKQEPTASPIDIEVGPTSPSSSSSETTTLNSPTPIQEIKINLPPSLQGANSPQIDSSIRRINRMRNSNQ